MLKTQYRMNEQIMSFSNHKFYRDELKAEGDAAIVGVGH